MGSSTNFLTSAVVNLHVNGGSYNPPDQAPTGWKLWNWLYEFFWGEQKDHPCSVLSSAALKSMIFWMPALLSWLSVCRLNIRGFVLSFHWKCTMPNAWQLATQHQHYHCLEASVAAAETTRDVDLPIKNVSVAYPGIFDRGCVSRLSQSYCTIQWKHW